MQLWKAWANSGRMDTFRLFLSSSRSLRAFTAALIILSKFALSVVLSTSASHLRSMWSQSLSSGRCLSTAALPLEDSSMSSTVRSSICGTAATTTFSLLMYCK